MLNSREEHQHREQIGSALTDSSPAFLPLRAPSEYKQNHSRFWVSESHLKFSDRASLTLGQKQQAQLLQAQLLQANYLAPMVRALKPVLSIRHQSLHFRKSVPLTVAMNFNLAGALGAPAKLKFIAGLSNARKSSHKYY